DDQTLASRHARKRLAHRLHHTTTAAGEEMDPLLGEPAADGRSQRIVALPARPHDAEEGQARGAADPRHRSSRVHGIEYEPPRAKSAWKSCRVPVRKPATEPAR